MSCVWANVGQTSITKNPPVSGGLIHSLQIIVVSSLWFPHTGHWIDLGFLFQNLGISFDWDADAKMLHERLIFQGCARQLARLIGKFTRD